MPSSIYNALFNASEPVSLNAGSTIPAAAVGVPGNNTQTVGASTAATGTNSGSAAGLPAATGAIYPTTAADGTKGVIIDVTDKVSGRVLFIGGTSGAQLNVYPPSGGKINGGTTDSAYLGRTGSGVLAGCISATSNTWLCIG